MKRGFPRPRVDYADKTYPIPYSAMDGELVSASPGRTKECLLFGKCGICGLQVDPDELCMIAVPVVRGRFGLSSLCDESDINLNNESGPFHPKCARLTLAMCPHFGVDYKDVSSSGRYADGVYMYTKSFYFASAVYREVRHLLVEVAPGFS